MKRLKEILISMLFLINLTIWFSNYTLYSEIGITKFTFLDIGQGDSLLIKTAQNNFALIDSGKGSVILEELATKIPYTNKELEFIAITHPDADHMEGFIEIVKQFKVKRIFMVKTNKTNELIKTFESEVLKRQIPVYELKNIHDFTFDEITFEVLWPESTTNVYDIDNVNNTSISFLISADTFDILAMGDLESEFELKALKNINTSQPIEIFKVSHHGSRTSSNIEVLRQIDPAYSIISAGENNSYNHPHPEVLHNLQLFDTQIYRTDSQGTIEIKVNKGNALISCTMCSESKVFSY